MKLHAIGLVCLVACGGGGENDGPIEIERTNTHVVEDRESQVAAPFAGGELSAWGIDQTTGAFVELAVDIDGSSATIGDPPEGEIYLVLATGDDQPRRVVVTASRRLELGRPILGRAGVDDPMGAAFILDLTGLEPWKLGLDEVHMYSAGAGMQTDHLTIPSNVEPPEGGTELFSPTTPPRQTIDAGAGDVSHLVQLSGTADRAGVHLSVVSRATVAFTLGDVLEAAFSPAGATRPFSTAIETAAFDSVLDGAGLPATERHHRIDVDARPGAPSYGDYGAGATLAVVRSTGDADVAANAAPLDGYPTSWTRVARLVVEDRLDYGSASGDVHLALSWVVDELANLDGASVSPRIGPPRDITLDGQPTTAPLVLVSTTPEIRWSPPTLGEPDYYRLVVLAGETGPERPVAEIITTETAVRVPPEVLTSGFVAVLIEAIDGNPDAREHPFRRTYPEAGATAATAAAAVP